MAHSHLVHLVCGAVLSDSDRDGGLVRQRYPQLYICHSVVVLEGKGCALRRSAKSRAYGWVTGSICTTLYEDPCMCLAYVSRETPLEQQTQNFY